VGPVIGQERKRQAAELFGPGLQTRNRVGADLQNLDAGLPEFIVVRTEPADLIPSSAGEREGQKRDDSGFAAETAQRKLLIRVRGEREVGCRGAWLEFHALLLFGLG
jgi:hypothetical protein